MKILKKTQGEGITRRDSSSPQYDMRNPHDVEQIKQIFENMERNFKLPWMGKSHWIDQVRAEDQEWQANAPDEDIEHEAYEAYYKPYSTEAWYIRCVVTQINVVESAVENDRPWEAVNAAMNIGAMLKEMDLKFKWEPAALFGDEQMGKLRQGGQSRRKYQPEVIAQFVNNLLDDKKAKRAMNKSAAVSLAAEHFSIAKSTVYNNLKVVKESTPTASDKSN